LAAFIESGGRAIGCHLETDEADHGRRSRDLGHTNLRSVAIAMPHDDPALRRVLVFDASPPLLAELAAWWAEEDAPPYVVFFHAQHAMRCLRPLGLTPARYGCLTTLLTLLEEGTARPPRDLSAAVDLAFGRELVPPMATAAQMAAREADALVPLLKHHTPELRRAHLGRAYEVECQLVPAVVDMEATGVAFDAPAFERLAQAWATERESTEAPDRIARLDKLLSTYAHWGRSYVGEDGRIRCRLHPLATDSGRFSCSDPNLQQVPSPHTAPGFRRCFRAAEGAVLVIADYSQIELRVAAQLAPCDALTRVFMEGRDPHRATAATLVGKPESEITSRQRKLAKAINFGFLFGMGARRFREYASSSYGLDLGERDAEEARAAFFRTYPGIRAWHERTRQLSNRARREDVTVMTVLGRRKRFEAGHFSFPAALNIPVQGTAAEGFKLAMIALHERLPQLGGRGVLTVHDEYLAEVPRERSEEGRALVVDAMVAGMRQVIDRVPISVEAEVADHWGA